MNQKEYGRKCTVKNVPALVPVFLYAVTNLNIQLTRIILGEKWLTMSVYFILTFVLIAKLWMGWMTLNGEKKRWPKVVSWHLLKDFCLIMV